MIDNCATLSFAMATLMMTFSTLAFCKMSKKSCADGALLSLVGIGVGVVAVICVFPQFQHMIQNLPIINTIIGSNGIIAIVVDCFALALTATLATLALSGPFKMKQNTFKILYQCFFVGLIIAAGISYFIDSGCVVTHSHQTKSDR